MGLGERLRRSWNVFTNKDPTETYIPASGATYSQRPDRPRLTRGNERSVITSLIVRMALDVASTEYRHCRLNDNGYYESDMDSGLNECLTLAANIDQTSRAFMQDVAMTMMDKGCVAIVPVDIDTKDDPALSDAYDILSMRVGEIMEWRPAHVRVRVYDDQTGLKKDILVPKKTVAIIENPLYAIMNEPNSAMQRLIRKLSLLDITDEQTASGKLDLIIQLPYVIKSDARRAQADKRRADIETQLAGSKYGIAYTDGTEKITQLNRPVENTLMNQIQYLMEQVFSQIGMTQSILDGTANEQTMLNYYTRTVEPIVAVIVAEMKRTFLSKTARTQKQSIESFRDPFKLVPINQIAEIADKFTRNEILTANEVREIVGRKPSKDPKANKLQNSNISQSKQNGPGDTEPAVSDKLNNEGGENQNGD